MDKNLKAELYSLRSEVLTNLKNIEGLVEKIDSKLQDEEESQAISKMPSVSRLLTACDNVVWDKDAPTQAMVEFNDARGRLKMLLESSMPEKMTEWVSDIVRLTRAMDKSIIGGPLQTGPAYETDYEVARKAEIASIKGTIAVVESTLSGTDVLDPKEMAVQRILAEVEEKINPTKEPECDDIDLSLAPEWAKNTHNKSMREIIKEASSWDSMNQQIFVNGWNKSKKRRIELLRSALEDVLVTIKALALSGDYKVANVNDAKKLMERYEAFEKAKDDVCQLIRTFDQSILEEILANDRDDNFVRFYEWMADLGKEVFDWTSGNHVLGQAHMILKSVVSDRSLEIYDMVLIDPATFEPIDHMKKDPVKALEYRKRAHKVYMEDLKQAYDYLARTENGPLAA